MADFLAAARRCERTFLFIYLFDYLSEQTVKKQRPHTLPIFRSLFFHLKLPAEQPHIINSALNSIVL